MPKHINGLRRCPRCGTYPNHYDTRSDRTYKHQPWATHYHKIVCPKCGYLTYPEKTLTQAKRSWNHGRIQEP